jgi:hypothetical protein
MALFLPFGQRREDEEEEEKNEQGRGLSKEYEKELTHQLMRF